MSATSICTGSKTFPLKTFQCRDDTAMMKWSLAPKKEIRNCDDMRIVTGYKRKEINIGINISMESTLAWHYRKNPTSVASLPGSVYKPHSTTYFSGHTWYFDVLFSAQIIAYRYCHTPLFITEKLLLSKK